MKKIFLSSLLMLFVLLGFFSCIQNVEEFSPPPVFADKIKEWKNPVIDMDNSLTVSLEVTRNIDCLYWTKADGEVIYPELGEKNGNRQKSEIISFKRGIHTFKFDEPGRYVLNIYQRPGGEFNKNDEDFRGVVNIGICGVKIKDSDYGETCVKQGRFEIINNQEQTITSITYLQPVKYKVDLFEKVFSYEHLNINQGVTKSYLFPLECPDILDEYRYILTNVEYLFYDETAYKGEENRNLLRGYRTWEMDKYKKFSYKVTDFRFKFEKYGNDFLFVDAYY